MKLLPRSLFGRNLLLIAVLIVVAQLSAGLIFQRLVLRPRTEQFASYARQYVEAVQTALVSMPANARPAYLGRLNAGVGTPDLARVVQGEAAPAGSAAEPPERLLRWALAPLRRELAADYPLRWQQRPQRWLWLQARVDGASYWIGLPVEGLVHRTSYPLVIAWLMSLLLALLGAALIQRRIDKPLRELAAAAGQVARAEPVSALTEEGPREYAVVARSFNQMAQSLAHAEQERALMLAGVSHDLRTPLTNLRLAVEMLASDGDPLLVASAVRNVEAADRILDQFIEFARLGNDEATQPSDLATLVREAVSAMAAEMPVVSLALANVPVLALRPLAVRRLLQNLLVNAARHGAPPYAVSMVVKGGRIELSIRDGGPGIAPEVLARVTQPFARGEAARSGKPGAGLGLAIAARVARLHGGELRLENLPEGGFAAVLSLPVR